MRKFREKSNTAAKFGDNLPVEPQRHSGLTVIIPTLNEFYSIGLLLDELCKRFRGVTIVVVDDVSSDGTQDVVLKRAREMNTHSSTRIELLERRGALIKGISASVVDAISSCRTEFFAVMDGDLQHPPAAIEPLVAKLQAGADLVVGTRLPGTHGQSALRTVISKVATFIARVFLFFRGVRVEDPMSGFFGARTLIVQDIIANFSNCFEPRGYKILFDILRYTSPDMKIHPSFYQFGSRCTGKSKLHGKHGLYFLRSLTR